MKTSVAGNGVARALGASPKSDSKELLIRARVAHVCIHPAMDDSPLQGSNHSFKGTLDRASLCSFTGQSFADGSGPLHPVSKSTLGRDQASRQEILFRWILSSETHPKPFSIFSSLRVCGSTACPLNVEE